MNVSPRAAIGYGALAACLVGLLGSDAGLVLLVAGVFTVRSLQGRPVGLAWGIACVGAGVRWGTLGLGDVEAATRLLGPTVLAGNAVVRAGMIAALVAALVGESHIDGLRASTWPDRVVAVFALLALVAAFASNGPGTGGLAASLALWIAVGGVASTAVLLGAPLARRVPMWAPPCVAAAGVAIAGAVR